MPRPPARCHHQEDQGQLLPQVLREHPAQEAQDLGHGAGRQWGPGKRTTPNFQLFSSEYQTASFLNLRYIYLHVRKFQSLCLIMWTWFAWLWGKNKIYHKLTQYFLHYCSWPYSFIFFFFYIQISEIIDVCDEVLRIAKPPQPMKPYPDTDDDEEEEMFNSKINSMKLHTDLLHCVMLPEVQYNWK